jgi:hypothetical protein
MGRCTNIDWIPRPLPLPSGTTPGHRCCDNDFSSGRTVYARASAGMRRACHERGEDVVACAWLQGGPAGIAMSRLPSKPTPKSLPAPRKTRSHAGADIRQEASPATRPTRRRRGCHSGRPRQRPELRPPLPRPPHLHVIGSDGGLLSWPVPMTRLRISPAERFEILVDFSDGKLALLETGPDEVMGIFGAI